MANNGNNNRHTKYISRVIQFLRNGEEYNLHHTVWCKGGLQLADIGPNNFRGDELNPGLLYSMIRLDH